jgi:hypothetical protein
MSALPPKADIVQHGGNVRFVPKADSCAAAIGATAIAGNAEFSPAGGAADDHPVNFYSMIWSALNSTVGGILRPSAFAVFWLIHNSSVVGNSTGKSAGLAPFSILST